MNSCRTTLIPGTGSDENYLTTLSSLHHTLQSWLPLELVHSGANSAEIVDLALVQNRPTPTLSYLVFAVAAIFLNKF